MKKKRDQREYHREYYLNHRDIIREKGKEIIECKLCGEMIRKSYMCNHRRTAKCICIAQENEHIKRKENNRYNSKLFTEDPTKLFQEINEYTNLIESYYRLNTA